MSSSDSSRDGSNNNNKNINNENIFIQFKRNVDHQISAILSGFIGVPSHIKRNERSEDNRWQDIEDDRQRRIDEREQNDRYMASQEQSSNLPVMRDDRQQAAEDGQDHNIPVKKYRLPAPSPVEQQSGCPELNNDYDLYSPFGTPELERLNMACKIKRPAHLRILEGVQERFFVSMKDAWHASQDSEMAKEKTLMPYLLFSDYSPLRLTHLPPLRRRDMPGVVTFSYAEAFEDLLELSKDETSQPSAFEEVNDMFKAFGVPSGWILGANQGFGGRLGRQPMRSPLTAMEWIAGSLVEKDVFKDESLYETVETPIGTFRAGQYSAVTEVLLNWMWNKHGYEAALRNPRSQTSDFEESPFKWPKEEKSAPQNQNNKEPRTEQDMYDDFFSTPPAARVKYMDKDDEDESVFTSGSTSSKPSQSFGTQTSVLDHTPAPSPPETEAHKNPWSWSSIQKPNETASEKVVLISNVPGENATAADDTNGLVSHEVTEESETLPEGTVKTTVITKKKYGNGKSQVMISTSFDKPAENRMNEGRQEGEVEKDGKGVVTKVKEWFWK